MIQTREKVKKSRTMKPGTVTVGMKLMAPTGYVEVLKVREGGWCWCKYIWSYHHHGSSAMGRGCEGWWKETMLRRKTRADKVPERLALYGTLHITTGGSKGEYPSSGSRGLAVRTR